MTRPWRTLTRSFVMGIVALVPLLTTIYILYAVFNVLNNVVGKHIDELLSQYLPLEIQGVGVLVTLLIIVLAGFLASTVLGRRLVWYGERLVTRVPVAKEIYPAAKQIIEFIVAPKDPSFRKVVAVPFPQSGHYAIGFQTGESPPRVCDAVTTPMISIFIPTSPSPITGFTVMMPASDVIPLDMTTEEAVKFIVSAGVLASGELTHRALSKGGDIPE